MANIVRADPFGSAFDDLFKGFFLRPVRFDPGVDAPAEIRMDVSEDDKSYMVKAELPGVKKEDVHVSIDGNRVSISAEVKREKEEKSGEKVIRSERYFGQVQRSFTLQSDIDEGRAEAKFTDGVLNLSLPKRAPASARRLTIS